MGVDALIGAFVLGAVAGFLQRVVAYGISRR